MRQIQNVLLFRNDFSPFLVHLTRDYNDASARQNLVSILKSGKLRYGSEAMSVARYRYPYPLNDVKTKLYFKAVSFTDTPLNQIHNLLNIDNRAINLSCYGLVFLKSRCMTKGASPVFYINNTNGDKDKVVEALCNLSKSDPGKASKILPFISFFGKKLRPYNKTPQEGEMDFTWEREWRYSNFKGYFQFDKSDVFIGLCPHDRIKWFESHFDWLKFVDPRRNLAQYAERLESAKVRSGIQNSVI